MANIILTFDVEDWFQVENLRPWFPPETWDHQTLRVEQNTHKILDLLDSINLAQLNKPNKPNKHNKHNKPSNPTNPINPRYARATFFTLGWIAERLPHLVREIHARGHEVASHGFNHLMCSQLDEEGLKQDLTRSKKLLEDITGTEVKGYRAPSFSISDSTIEIVQTSGYQYDSSYNNFSKHGRYGTITINGNHKTTSAFKLDNNLTELPISNLTIGNQVIPWGGGGYFRFFPFFIFKSGVKKILKQSNTYTFYMHPWELDPMQPKVKNSNGKAGWKHYLNLDKTQERLKALISAFNHCNFPTCGQYLKTTETQRTQRTQ